MRSQYALELYNKKKDGTRRSLGAFLLYNLEKNKNTLEIVYLGAYAQKNGGSEVQFQDVWFKQKGHKNKHRAFALVYEAIQNWNRINSPNNRRLYLWIEPQGFEMNGKRVYHEHILHFWKSVGLNTIEISKQETILVQTRQKKLIDLHDWRKKNYLRITEVKESSDILVKMSFSGEVGTILEKVLEIFHEL